MRRILLVLVSLCLVLSLSAGSTALASVDAVRDAAHGQHEAARDEHPACGQTAHTDVTECQASCLSSSHCMSGAMPLTATLSSPALATRPPCHTGVRPTPPCFMDERPPKTA